MFNFTMFKICTGKKKHSKYQLWKERKIAHKSMGAAHTFHPDVHQAAYQTSFHFFRRCHRIITLSTARITGQYESTHYTYFPSSDSPRWIHRSWAAVVLDVTSSTESIKYSDRVQLRWMECAEGPLNCFFFPVYFLTNQCTAKQTDECDNKPVMP